MATKMLWILVLVLYAVQYASASSPHTGNTYVQYKPYPDNRQKTKNRNYCSFSGITDVVNNLTDECKRYKEKMFGNVSKSGTYVWKSKHYGEVFLTTNENETNGKLVFGAPERSITPEFFPDVDSIEAAFYWKNAEHETEKMKWDQEKTLILANYLNETLKECSSNIVKNKTMEYIIKYWNKDTIEYIFNPKTEGGSGYVRYPKDAVAMYEALKKAGHVPKKNDDIKDLSRPSSGDLSTKADTKDEISSATDKEIQTIEPEDIELSLKSKKKWWKGWKWPCFRFAKKNSPTNKQIHPEKTKPQH